MQKAKVSSNANITQVISIQSFPQSRLAQISPFLVFQFILKHNFKIGLAAAIAPKVEKYIIVIFLTVVTK